MNTMKYCYLSLVAFRFILTLMPQNGYIHPDEFFQSSEVVYGDLLEVQSLKTWEFELGEPIRSIVFPYIMMGLPSMFFRIFDVQKLFGTEIFPYFLLVVPRLLMCLLSLVHDLCLFRISKLTKKNPFEVLIIFASSYVTLIYLPRTFSNSLEAACLSILIYTVISKSVIPTKLKSDCRESTHKSSILIGVLFTCGCFIRPTFVLFSFVPVIVWLIVLSESFTHQCHKICSFLLAVIITSSFFAFVDTIYYEGECHIFRNPSYAEFKNMVFTPLNFILYNLDTKNLALHGQHPRYLHFLVNIPLLYSVLGVLTLWQCLSTVACLLKNRTLNCSKRELFFLFSFLVPIIFLSLFPHQEPRFLISTLLPLVCFSGEQLYTYLVKYKIITFMWLTTNILGILFFGFVHQGGIYPALSFFHAEIAKNPSHIHNIVFYHTYMPPRHLLAIPKSQKNVNVHDLLGSDDTVLFETMQTILKYSRTQDHLYLALPSTITIPLINLNIMLQPDYKLHQIEGFFPHVSIEDAPSMSNVWSVMKSRYPILQKMASLRSFFSLNIYEVRRIK